MNIEKLEEMVDKDVAINHTILHKESLETPRKHNKYLKMLLRERLKLKKIKDDYNKVRLGRTNFYNGNDPEPYEYVLGKNEVKDYVITDDITIADANKVALQEEIVKYLEEVCKIFERRGFAIKNAIDYMKFTQGEI